ncbi:crotonase/enoyl-CoA hydratase family protein [Albibacillus kandeliae]|uniref:crotonase/enoyl-CoA hydratase family protein n=1 Tax=Albibacillus kandeliae TaxID=2174228 RepID=UPI000D694316|nr:crotonase/enoyl-CoA hydratase family protein [Albibacillus kandeliae]
MPGDSYQTIATDLDGGILTITMNRPERLNTFSALMARELIAAFDVADSDDAVRAVIVTGAGRAFCAGVDLDDEDAFTSAKVDPASTDPAVWSDPANRDIGGLLTLRIFRCLKPVIAAVNGPAVGVGATMQLAMDFRLASDKARFGFVFARRGIVPEACSSWFLPRIVGISQALEWTMSGRVFDADEAHAARLVRSTHAPDDLLPAARALAEQVSAPTAPVSVAITRQMMWRMLGADHPMAAHQIESRAIAARSASGDAAEGVASFLEKRDAQFPDRVGSDMPGFFPWWEEPQWA